MKMWALKSKKSGRFFKFEEYCEDGYGEYIDSVSSAFSEDGLPDFFNGFNVTQGKNPSYAIAPWMSLKDHTVDDVDIVVFELTEIGESQ